MEDPIHEKNGNCIYILNVLKKYTYADPFSDTKYVLKSKEIRDKVKEEYGIDNDDRTIRRNMKLLKEKLGYDIVFDEEKKGYYILRDSDTEFEPGEIRAIIDTFSYASYITPSIAKQIIGKCKKMQSIYENNKLKDYKVYSVDNKTTNLEVIKNIEDISKAIIDKEKITFEYWKYVMEERPVQKITSHQIVAPYAIVYNSQEFYMIAIKEEMEKEKKFYVYRIDWMKKVAPKKKNNKRVINKTDAEIKEFIESTLDMFNGEKEKIVFIADNDLIRAVMDKFGKYAQIEKYDENNFKVTLEISMKAAEEFLKRNIDKTKVLEPESLKNKMIEIIENASKRYNN